MRDSDGHAPTTTTTPHPVSYNHRLKSMRFSYEAMSSMMDTSFEAGFLVETNGSIGHMNQAAMDLFGVTTTTIMGTAPLHISTYLTIVSGEDSIVWQEFKDLLLLSSSSSSSPKQQQQQRERRRQLHGSALGWQTNGRSFDAAIHTNLLIDTDMVVMGDDDNNNNNNNDCRCLVAIFVRKLESVDKAQKRVANLLNGIVETSMDPILHMNTRGRIELVNAAAIQKFGYTRDELLGNHIDVLVGGVHAKHHVTFIRRFLHYANHKQQAQHPQQAQQHYSRGVRRVFMAQRKDKTEFPVEIALTKISTSDDDVFVGFFRDLTNQRKQQERLQRREACTNKIIEASYTALLVADRNGNIQRVNAAAVEKFEWDRDALCQKSIHDVFDQNHAKEIQHEFDQFVSVGIPPSASRVEIQAIKQSGVAFPSSVALAALEQEETHTGCSFAVYVQDLTFQKRMTQIEVDKAAAEMLLRNVLPEKIVRRLQESPTHMAESHESATILFADIVGFTTMSSQMSPQQVVRMLNELFSMFDELVDKYDLNKIKTIGDCYMVSSVPVVEHDENDVSRVCYFALDMVEAIGRYNDKNRSTALNLRIGINVGPVVAGVVGTTRFLYDLWGDAVNVASRMESTGLPGQIQVTRQVVDKADPHFHFGKRGLIPIKGKGEIETYLLEGCARRPSLKPKHAAAKQSRRRSVLSKQMRRLSTGGRYENFEDLVNSFSSLGETSVASAANNKGGGGSLCAGDGVMASGSPLLNATEPTNRRPSAPFRTYAMSA